MQIIQKCFLPGVLALMMLVVDIPLLPVELVGEAEAVFGVRRRTAVIAYSAGSAHASSAAAASQQQAAAAQQQTAAAQQQAEAAEQEAAAAKQEAAAAQQQLAATQQQAQPVATPSASAVPIGTIVNTLPGKCVAVTVGNVQYQECGGSFYRAAFQGNSLIYVVVDRPI